MTFVKSPMFGLLVAASLAVAMTAPASSAQVGDAVEEVTETPLTSLVYCGTGANTPIDAILVDEDPESGMPAYACPTVEQDPPEASAMASSHQGSSGMSCSDPDSGNGHPDTYGVIWSVQQGQAHWCQATVDPSKSLSSRWIIWYCGTWCGSQASSGVIHSYPMSSWTGDFYSSSYGKFWYLFFKDGSHKYCGANDAVCDDFSGSGYPSVVATVGLSSQLNHPSISYSPTEAFGGLGAGVRYA